MIDLTPKYTVIPAKEKIIIDDTPFGARFGGLEANATSVQQGDGNNIYKVSPLGLHLGAADFSDAPFSVSMAGSVVANDLTLTGGTIKFGKTSFADTANEGYIMNSSGIYFGSASDTTKLKYDISTGVFDFIGTISSRSTATLATAINSSGNLVTDLINARLDSSTKKILADFNFGTTDYAGAVKSGDIAWNTTTGAITGGSGVVVYRGGIIGAAAGVATFSLDATTGNATFAGTLSAAAGTLGAITAGTLTGLTITGGTIQTSTSGSRVVLSGTGDNLTIIDGSDNNVVILNDSSRILSIAQYTNAQAILIQNNSDTALTSAADLVAMEVTNASSDDNTLRVSNDGTGAALRAVANAAGLALNIQGGTSRTALFTTSVDVDSGILIDHNGDGVALEIDMDKGSSTNATVALKIAVDNGSENPVEYAFQFAGSESAITSSGNGGFVSNSQGTLTLTGFIRILTAAGTRYIPYGTIA